MILDPQETPCWEWPINDCNGYRKVTVNGRKVFAHRAVYELVAGPVPSGLELDHLCQNRACVNPFHLEPVTHAENVRRGRSGILQVRSSHCRHGHLYDEANTRYDKNGNRCCRACQREGSRRHRLKKAAL